MPVRNCRRAPFFRQLRDVCQIGDVAGAAIYLASQAGGMTNRAVVAVDGG